MRSGSDSGGQGNLCLCFLASIRNESFTRMDRSPICMQWQVDGKVHLVFEGTPNANGDRLIWMSGKGDMGSDRKGCGEYRLGGKVGRSCLPEGRLRLSLAQGSVKGGAGWIEGDTKGEFSFASGLGAKWELEGSGSARGEQFPISCKGRAFLHEARPHWVESEAYSRRGPFFPERERRGRVLLLGRGFSADRLS